MSGLKVKTIAQLMEDALHMDLSEEKKTVLRAIDLSHKDMSELRDWKKLRMKKAFSMTGADTVLPDNLIGITGVRSTTEVYFKSEEEDILSVDGRPHWVYASQEAASPSADEYFNIYDVAGTAATDNVTVFYWAYPDTITSDNDDILVPGPKAIAMLSIVLLLGFLNREPTEAEPFRDAYNRAMTDMLSRYPATSHAKAPRGRHGQPIALGDIG